MAASAFGAASIDADAAPSEVWSCSPGLRYDAARITLRLAVARPSYVEMNGERRYALHGQVGVDKVGVDKVGVDERWEWGLNDNQTAYDHRIVLDIKDRAVYYDFSAVALGEDVEASAQFACRRDR